jgi:phosphoribosylformylglycinamidine (FGAM) synthase-like amidotransferase family enzyme
MKVSINILYFPGTNCQRETVLAFQRVGAEPNIIFLTDILAGRRRLDDADVLCIPGGFSFGDHIAAGAIAGLFLKTKLADQLENCRKRPILCICNGFQIGVRAGLFGSSVALTVNNSGTFRHVKEQAHYASTKNSSFWLDEIRGETLFFPAAHGEGRFVFATQEGWEPALLYSPAENPDGSMGEIAGITTADGLILGIMNHPERAQHDPLNLQIFQNCIRWVR